MVRVGITGAGGRMGRTLMEACNETRGVKCTAAFERSGHPLLGTDAGSLAGEKASGVLITDDIAGNVDEFDVLIDFSVVNATLGHVEICGKAGKKMVIGTTGFTHEQQEFIEAESGDIAVVWSANFSAGVNVMFKLIEEGAKAFGDTVDVEILEAHHRHKVDAPSGTALKMGEVVAKATNRDLRTAAVYERRGHTGERKEGTIGFQTLRGGDITGEHTVMFCGLGERIEVVHKSWSRMTYASGAVRAAQWVAKKKNGLFDMQDVLGLRE